MLELPPRFYVTGTDTDVGKTFVSTLLCRALGLDYVKPVQSGLPADTDTVAQHGVRTWPETWRLRNPKSPHRAAADDGAQIDIARVRLPDAPRLLVEGAGGWMVPLGPGLWQADLVRHLDLPVLVVCRTTLGTLNHTSLTVRAIRADGLRMLGLIASGPPHPENLADLPGLTGVPLLAWVPRVEGGVEEALRVWSGRDGWRG